eukprot:SAG22_NODE_70_length_22717_cov_12.413741_14_plen_352_part_00
MGRAVAGAVRLRPAAPAVSAVHGRRAQVEHRRVQASEPPATKREILSHFEDVVAAVLLERNIELVTLFGFEHDGNNSVVEEPQGTRRRVRLLVRPVIQQGPESLPPVTVTADRLIKAGGFDVREKRPLELSPAVAGRVHSLCPADVGTAAWNARMRYGAGAQAPIWVVGSGKTAMDTIIALAGLGPAVASRVHCIAGRGTMFVDRDRPPKFIEMVAQVCGSGAEESEVLQALLAEGRLHSAIPDPQSFVVGLCSRAELATVRATLAPAAERIVKGGCQWVGPRRCARTCQGSLPLRMPAAYLTGSWAARFPCIQATYSVLGSAGRGSWSCKCGGWPARSTRCRSAASRRSL